MSYEVLVPTDWFELREFEIVEKNLADVGIELTPVEADGATWFELNTAPDGEYLEFDITMESWNLEFDPNFMLDVFTCRQWFNWNDSGYCDKGYDALFREQVAAVDQEKRREIVWEMQDQIVNQHRVYVPLVAHDEVSAHSVEWTGFHPELATWSKFEWTEVQRSSTA